VNEILRVKEVLCTAFSLIIICQKPQECVELIKCSWEPLINVALKSICTE
jgi:hypothetical protein